METPDRFRSRELFTIAKRLMPGGVNSPVRAFRAVGGEPLFITRGKGAYIWDADGYRYIDLVGSWGPLILGHMHPAVESALRDVLGRGTSFGACTGLEVELAALIVEAFPAVEMVRFVNSGTEATMSALRLARAFTRRDKILKFEGCYHGHVDSLLIKAGSGALTFGVPSSPGVPASIAADTLVASYNDIVSVEKAFKEHGAEIAAVIVEPVAANMGLVLPETEFLYALRELTRKNGALLIFDEVITGFRLGYGGAQNRFNLAPDLTCLGKIIGGGLPVGAYGGRREIMETVAPIGPVYQAGTLSGNPLAMAAGIATLLELKKEGVYEALEENGEYLAKGLAQAAAEAGFSVTRMQLAGTEVQVDLEPPGAEQPGVTVASAASILGLFFTKGPIRNYEAVMTANTACYQEFFWEMIAQGVYMAPSPFEAIFISTAHTREDLDAVIDAARRSFRKARMVCSG